MDQIRISGGRQLKGRIPISGAKNAALALLPAALLTDEPLTLRNLPRLADVDTYGHLPVSYTHLDVYKRQVLRASSLHEAGRACAD